MKKYLFAVFLSVIFLQTVRLQAQNDGIGRIWPSEMKTWTDDSTGCKITQWTTRGNNWHLYFNIESFIDDNNALIYSDRSGKVNLFRLDFTTGEMLQLTDEKEEIHGIWHLPKYKTVWFLSGRQMKTLNTGTNKIDTVYTFSSLIPEAFAVTCDSKYLVFSANKNPGYSENNSTGPYGLFKMDLATKQIMQISPDYGFKIGHVQTNPVDPDVVSFCWQHQYRVGGEGTVGNAPIRIWWNNLEGTAGGPVGPQEFGIHRTHEFWFPDGKKMGFSARYLFGPNKGLQYIGTTTLDGKGKTMFPANVSAAHSQVYLDGIHWISDQFNGPYLVMFTLGTDKISETKILFRHNSSWGAQPTHPHPHFSPDGKYILFSTDRTGSPQVYTVEVNLSKNIQH
jgi:oligogalacturonide lyase